MAKKNFVGVSSLSVLDKTKVKNAMASLNDSMTRAAAEKDFIKEVVSNLSQDVGLDPKLIKKMAKTFFKASFVAESEEHQAFEEIYQAVILTKTP